MQPGEKWAYRAPKSQAPECVEVLEPAAGAPKRVLVRFVGGASDRLEESVPVGRLRQPWARWEATLEEERREARLLESGAAPDSPRAIAAERVLALLVDASVARFDRMRGSTLTIRDTAALVGLAGLTESALVGHPESFFEDSSLVVPWEVAEAVAIAAARSHAERVLEAVREEEAEARYDAVFGRHVQSGWYGETRYSSPEECVRIDTASHRPSRVQRFAWAAADQLDALMASWVERGATSTP